jgi:hypothetical protein
MSHRLDHVLTLTLFKQSIVQVNTRYSFNHLVEMRLHGHYFVDWLPPTLRRLDAPQSEISIRHNQTIEKIRCRAILALSDCGSLTTLEYKKSSYDLSLPSLRRLTIVENSDLSRVAACTNLEEINIGTEHSYTKFVYLNLSRWTKLRRFRAPFWYVTGFHPMKLDLLDVSREAEEWTAEELKNVKTLVVDEHCFPHSRYRMGRELIPLVKKLEYRFQIGSVTFFNGGGYQNSPHLFKQWENNLTNTQFLLEYTRWLKLLTALGITPKPHED